MFLICYGGFENFDDEYDYWIDNIEGEILLNLVGIFFRNGFGC